MTTKSFFIDINRYSAQDSESDITNIWDYKLNDTILAPSGTTVSIENAFINQKGITGQSIEFEEDIVETIQYYSYITEDQQSVPSAVVWGAKDSQPTTNRMYDELLNNLGDTGKHQLYLMNNEGEIALQTYSALNGHLCGGSGTPLILSSAPFQDPSDYQFEVPATCVRDNTTITMATAGIAVGDGLTSNVERILDGQTRVVSITSATALVVDKAPIAPQATATTTTFRLKVRNNPDFFTQPAPQSAFITIKKGVYGIQQLTTIINSQFNNQFRNGTQIPISNVELATGGRFWDGTLNFGNAGFTHSVEPLKMRPAPDGIWERTIDAETNPPSHCFIPAWDYAVKRPSFAPNKQATRINYSKRINPDDDANKGFIGFLTDNDRHSIYNLTSFSVAISRFNVAFEVGQRHDIEVGMTVEGDGIMANTVVAAVSGKDISLDKTPLKSGTFLLNFYKPGNYEDPETKNVADYQIGARGLMVGAPEVNIQFDTDLSAFSINNLHASYRIASHDILGNENPSAGKVGVGLKRIAETFDLDPWGAGQTLWGNPAAIGTHTASPTDNRNILKNVRLAGKLSVENIQIGATIEGAGFGIVNGQKCIITEVGSLTNPIVDDQGVPTQGLRINRPATATALDQDYTIVNQGVTTAVRSTLRSSLETPVSRVGGVIVFNFARQTANKYGDLVLSTEFLSHASFKEFFSVEEQARKIWKSKTLWGKLGFSYDQFNDDAYMEEIAQYNKTGGYKLRGITSNTKLDLSTIPQVSSQNNPSKFTLPANDGGGSINTPLQFYNNFDYNTPRTQRSNRNGLISDASNGDNLLSYAGSRYEMATLINVEANPTALVAESLPSLSKFGYYLITSDLIPTYKDVVSKGDPLGLLGIVAKTNLSNQDFIPVADSAIVQTLTQDTQIQNIKVKVLNPDLTNPALSSNSSIIIRLDVPIPPPSPPPPIGEKKHKHKKCPKTGEKICRCPPTSVGKKMESEKKKNDK
tara:strand:+ start:4289 stop:7237 length:2949 start_codon:yes stop_codon:yes gene_type:complete